MRQSASQSIGERVVRSRSSAGNHMNAMLCADLSLIWAGACGGGGRSKRHDVTRLSRRWQRAQASTSHNHRPQTQRTHGSLELLLRLPDVRLRRLPDWRPLIGVTEHRPRRKTSPLPSCGSSSIGSGTDVPASQPFDRLELSRREESRPGMTRLSSPST